MNEAKAVPENVTSKPNDTTTISDLLLPQSQQQTEQGNSSTISVTPFIFYITAWPSFQAQAMINKGTTKQ